MLLVQIINEEERIKMDFLRCPVCKKGRLCDKSPSEKVSVINENSFVSENKSNVIIKCPKCGHKIRMFLS